MTYGQDDRSDQDPQPGYGQQYRPGDQSWQPQYDPRQYQPGTGSPQEAPWQQAPYPPQDYPPRGPWQPQQPWQDYGQFQPPQQQDRQRSRTPLYAGLAAVLVIAAGGTAYVLAGHGSRHSPVSSSSPAASASTHPAAPAATPASLAQLKKIVLQAADLPPGWKGTPYQADPNTPDENAAMTKCLGVRNTYGDKVAEADSENFSLGNATISSSATSYRSQSDLDADVAMLHSPKLSACFGQLLTKQLAASLPAGTTIQSASIKITPGSAGGPANIVATGTGTVKVQANGLEIPIYLTVAFITGPLIESEVDAENVNAPVPASVVQPLVALVATRASKG
jgi:hypothetical protein